MIIMPGPDWLQFKHSMKVKQNELYHHGILGMHWGIRRFQPYPKDYNGDGKEVGKALRAQKRAEKKATKDETKRQKNISIGTERLENRIKRANALADVDKLSRKVGWENTKKASEVHKEVKNIKQVSEEILKSEVRTAALGNYTRKVRVGTIALSSTAASTLAVGGSLFITTVLGGPIGSMVIPIGMGAAVGKAGHNYYKKTKY